MNEGQLEERTFVVARCANTELGPEHQRSQLTSATRPQTKRSAGRGFAAATRTTLHTPTPGGHRFLRAFFFPPNRLIIENRFAVRPWTALFGPPTRLLWRTGLPASNGSLFTLREAPPRPRTPPRRARPRRRLPAPQQQQLFTLLLVTPPPPPPLSDTPRQTHALPRLQQLVRVSLPVACKSSHTGTFRAAWLCARPRFAGIV